jgi:hypothetical protein
VATAKKTDDKAAEKLAEAPKPSRNPLVASSINPSAGKSIDERMADLYADHKRMGAR